MKIKEIENHISKSVLKEAIKKIVRELDENPKGIFVAYVDDGNQSHDVQLETDATGEISKHQCDCESKNNFCVHKVAVVLKITNATNTKTKAKPKTKKLNANEKTMQTIDVDELKNWVLSLVASNKEIELAFAQRFAELKNHYSAKEIEKLTLDAVKALLNKRKQPETSELKKIVQLWNTLHKPIVDSYIANITNSEYEHYIIEIINSCLMMNESFRTSNAAVPTYVRLLLSKTYDAISAIESDEIWQNVVSKYVHTIWVSGSIMVLPYYQFVVSLLENNTPKRVSFIVQKIFDRTIDYTKQENVFQYHAQVELLDLSHKYNLFAKYYFLFTPIHYANGFNTNLISYLIEIKQYKNAEKYCNQIIAHNVNMAYNVTYLNFLRDIYTHTNEEIKKDHILKLLLPLTYNFEDYMYLYKKMPDSDEKKKWRANLLLKAKRESPYGELHTVCQEFCMQVMIAEGKSYKLIDYLVSNTSFALVIKYFEYFKTTESNLFIKQLCRIDDTAFGYFSRQPQSVENRETLANLIIGAYPRSLLLAMNNGRTMFSSRSMLVDLIQSKLMKTQQPEL